MPLLYLHILANKKVAENMATPKERVLKLTIMQHRKANISEQEFHEHWTKKHSAIASAWFVKNGILRYTQYHSPKATRDLAQGLVGQVGWTMSSYDGHVEIVVRSMDDLMKALNDPLYPDQVGQDEERFLDQSRSLVTVGWEEVFVKDGEVVNTGSEGSSAFA